MLSFCLGDICCADFQIAANENALIQPKFELGINGIIQNVFQGDKTTTTKQILFNFFLRGRVGDPYQLSLRSLERLVSQAGFYQGGRLVSETVF